MAWRFAFFILLFLLSLQNSRNWNHKLILPLKLVTARRKISTILREAEELREVEELGRRRGTRRVGFLTFFKKKKKRVQRCIYMNSTPNQPKPENNLTLRSKTQPEYSQTHPKPIESGRVQGWQWGRAGPKDVIFAPAPHGFFLPHPCPASPRMTGKISCPISAP